jgi:hypothetical protein
MSLGNEAASWRLVNPTRSASRIVVSKHSRVSASVNGGLSIRSIALSTKMPVFREKLWRDAVAVSYRTRGRTGGFPSIITYDETTVDHVWQVLKIREDCIGDPISVIVDARKQDTTPAEEGFTVEVILYSR